MISRLVPVLALSLVLAGSSPAAAADFDRTHGLYAQLLAAHVKGGLVDYAALKASRARLDGYVAALGSVLPQELAGWKRDDQFAFWINAYNAFTLKVVVDHYPIQGSLLSLYPKSSIRQIPGVWDKIFFVAAGRSLSLSQIEHEILRKQFVDPRLHAAINCASASCPELRGEPYLGDRLDAQLAEAARGFASGAARNQVDIPAKSIAASEIFNWYKDDFLKAYAPSGSFGGLTGKDAAAASFLATFAPQAAAAAIRAGGFAVRFLAYDWTLNDVPR